MKTVYASANSKRDNIIRTLKVRKISEALKHELDARFNAYLKAHKKSHTPERRMILDMIYRVDQPVDVETLLQLVCRDYGVVSQTTIYNCLTLLMDAQLVRKLELIEGGMAFFERTIGDVPHGYSVCRTCGAVSRFEQPELAESFRNLLPKGYRMDDVVLTVYGQCKKCLKIKNKPNNKTKQ